MLCRLESTSSYTPHHPCKLCGFSPDSLHSSSTLAALEFCLDPQSPRVHSLRVYLSAISTGCIQEGCLRRPPAVTGSTSHPGLPAESLFSICLPILPVLLVPHGDGRGHVLSHWNKGSCVLFLALSRKQRTASPIGQVQDIWELLMSALSVPSNDRGTCYSIHVQHQGDATPSLHGIEQDTCSGK